MRCQQPPGIYVYGVYVGGRDVCGMWGVRVYYGMARRWAVARVTRARARRGVATGCLSDEGAGVARET